VWLREAAGGEHALFKPDADSVHLLNHTALAIWDLCDGETRPEEMIAAIGEVSGLPREVVAEDVSRTLSDFDRANLITWTEDVIQAGDRTEVPPTR
jgi:Coenzyme PQQ synthesis protein D (PqqD)